jgi:hypothetical protein
MAQAMPVITLKQDFDPDEIPLVKIQQTYDDDTQEKMEIPIIDGRSIEATLYALNEFNEATGELSFDTGDELFRYFQCRAMVNTMLWKIFQLYRHHLLFLHIRTT